MTKIIRAIFIGLALGSLLFVQFSWFALVGSLVWAIGAYVFSE